MPLSQIIAFAVTWQVVWFALVIGGGAHQQPWWLLTALIPIVIGGWGRWRATGFIAGAGLILGIAADTLLGLSGMVRMPGGALDGQLPPPWMWCLWIHFAMATGICLGWMRTAWWIPIVFGAVGGPLAYLGGDRLNALQLSSSYSFIAVGIAYAIATPLLLRLSCSPRS